jgi:N-terminal half of MaoC dehydratase
MAIDRAHVGFTLPAFTVVVRAEALRQFAEAIGAAGDPAAGDPAAGAPVAGAPDHAPPTFMKVIEGANGSSRALVDALSIDLRRVMHSEQEFEYFAPIRAGDEITVVRRVVDIYDRKAGAMEFVVVESTLQNHEGVRVGRSKQWILVRNEMRPKSS